jgi:hypothetical protein
MNYNSATTLRGGFFAGRGISNTWGISNRGSGAMLQTQNVIALGENGSDDNHGLGNYDGAVATLRGGSFTGRGGSDTRGIYNTSDSTSTTLETEGVTVLGESGTSINCGLHNHDEAVATLRGGSFTGRGGAGTRGIYNQTDSATLTAESVTALGEDSDGFNYGLLNISSATATLRGGSFTARGGSNARGIYNSSSSTTLEAERITALGEDATNKYGLINNSSATANVTQSVLAGTTDAVNCNSGTVTISNSRLVSEPATDPVTVSGTCTATCVAVSWDGNFSTTGCP